MQNRFFGFLSVEPQQGGLSFVPPFPYTSVFPGFRWRWLKRYAKVSLPFHGVVHLSLHVVYLMVCEFRTRFVYYAPQDGDATSLESRWSCKPALGATGSGTCFINFALSDALTLDALNIGEGYQDVRIANMRAEQLAASVAPGCDSLHLD